MTQRRHCGHETHPDPENVSVEPDGCSCVAIQSLPLGRTATRQLQLWLLRAATKVLGAESALALKTCYAQHCHAGDSMQQPERQH